MASENKSSTMNPHIIINQQSNQGTNINVVKHDLNTKAQLSNPPGNGLPPLLPVIRRQPTSIVPATSYILVPATAIGTRVHLISSANAQQSTSSGTILVVASSPARVVQNAPAVSKSSNPMLSSSREDTISSSSNVVDDASLRQSMGHNRESLKRKLLQRRSIRELIDQGILPPPKTPPSYYEQRIKLERAKMGDILKHKIEHRPDKQQLVSQHILMDSSADPGILEKQQQLKRCKLADSLNEKLAARPGPLELVQENILHVDAALEQAIKDGRLQFKPTSAGLIQKRPQPVFVTANDVVSSNSTPNQGSPDSANICLDAFISPTPSDMVQGDRNLEKAFDSQFTTESLVTKPKPKKSKAKIRSVGSGSGLISKNATNGHLTKSASSTKLIRLNDSHKASPTLDNSTNKRLGNGGLISNIFGNGIGDMAKFNFPTPQFSTTVGSGSGDHETSYDLLLQQQQLLLQWQCELQQKYPNSTVQLVSLSSLKSSDNHFPIYNNASTADGTSIISSLQSSPGGAVGVNGGSTSQTPAPLSRSGSDGCAAVHGSNNKIVKRLEDMKVSDLKMECKKRNLPMSGSKSNIVERLKCFEDVILFAQQQEDGARAGSAGTGAFPQSPSMNSAITVQGGALPPISFLCSGSGVQNNLSSSITSSPNCQNHNVQQLAADAGHILGHRSSSSSDFPSNYSSPGIDLSGLNFGNGVMRGGGDEGQLGIDSTPGSITTSTQQYTFSTPDFGAQFLVTTAGSGFSPNCHYVGTNQIGCGAEQTVVAMDTADCKQNNGTLMRNSKQSNLAMSAWNVKSLAESPVPSSVQQPQQESFSFLQATNTLTVHEEVLRQQQKKIEEIQKELQKSQDLLRQQQQMIVAAKRIQAEANEGATSDADGILKQLDTKQIQKAHIQLFLQQKIQQQQLQQQINVQQELMEIQQKLQEEMAVHQALNEVVRVLRQEPRVSVLVLQLLRRHQMEQEQHQQQESPELLNSVSNTRPQKIRQEQPTNDAINHDETKMAIPMEANEFLAQRPFLGQYQQCNGTSSPASGIQHYLESGHVDPVIQSSTDAHAATSDGSNKAVVKNRQGSGQHTKKGHVSSVRASSMPTSPVKSKTCSTGDMEEIFRTVLEYATKATAKIFDYETTSPDKQQQNHGALPSFDQLLKPSRTVSEIETAITITNGSGILMTSAARNQEQQLPQLDQTTTKTTVANAQTFSSSFMTSTLPKRTTADGYTTAEASPSTAFLYTRNEAFDDLMEVLRNNEAQIPNEGNNTAISCPPSLSSLPDANGQTRLDINDRRKSQAHQQLNLLSAFGAQEVADLLGTEWFNVDSLLPQSASSSSAANNGDALNVTMAPDLNSAGLSVLSSGRVDKSTALEHSKEDVNSSVVLVSSDMAEQMDWLDLILPSPSSGAGNALHDLPVMNCLPMDTETGVSALDCTRNDTLVNANTTTLRNDFGVRHVPFLSMSTHNPVLAMSAGITGDAL